MDNIFAPENVVETARCASLEIDELDKKMMPLAFDMYGHTQKMKTWVRHRFSDGPKPSEDELKSFESWDALAAEYDALKKQKEVAIVRLTAAEAIITELFIAELHKIEAAED